MLECCCVQEQNAETIGSKTTEQAEITFAATKPLFVSTPVDDVLCTPRSPRDEAVTIGSVMIDELSPTFKNAPSFASFKSGGSSDSNNVASPYNLKGGDSEEYVFSSADQSQSFATCGTLSPQMTLSAGSLAPVEEAGERDSGAVKKTVTLTDHMGNRLKLRLSAASDEYIQTRPTQARRSTLMSFAADLMVGAKSSIPIDELKAQLHAFEQVRSDYRRERYKSVLRLGMKFVAGGLFMAFLGLASQSSILNLDMPVAGMILAGIVVCLGDLLCAGGVVLMSTCPLREVDVDQLIRSSVSRRLCIASILGIFGLINGIQAPHVHLLMILPSLLMLCVQCGHSLIPLPTTLIFVWLALFLLSENIMMCSSAFAELPHEVGERIPPVQLLVLAGVQFIMDIVWCGWWCWRRCCREDAADSDPRKSTPTIAFYGALYSFCCILGGTWIWWGALNVHYSVAPKDLGDGARSAGAGLAAVVPPLVLLALGRKTVFNFTGRRIEEEGKGREIDGAFLAAMLDSSGPKAGKEWWLHRDENEKDHDFPKTDHRYHWKPGRILSVDKEEMQFEVRDSQGGVHELPLAKRHLGWHELLEMARSALCCIEWKDLTLDMLKGNNPNSTGLRTSRKMKKDARQVPEGESIDFFISHSWYDDAELKWERLTEIVEVFIRTTNRDPTFWLDHICIDQLNIADGLKALPVNIMSCDRFIAFIGPTYLTRLWCVWELCTVMAFMPADLAIKHILAIPITNSEEPPEETFERFKEFDIYKARCYDPNEENRVFKVVGALGSDRFNESINVLGHAYLQSPSCFQTVTEMVGNIAGAITNR